MQEEWRPVLQYTKDGKLVARFRGISYASRILGIHQGNISNCCSGRHKSAGGFVWRYE